MGGLSPRRGDLLREDAGVLVRPFGRRTTLRTAQRTIRYGMTALFAHGPGHEKNLSADIQLEHRWEPSRLHVRAFLRYAHRAIGSHGELDRVSTLQVPSLARLDVGWEREEVMRRERQRRLCPDTRLRHCPNPHGNTGVPRRRDHTTGGLQSTHSLDFDVPNPFAAPLADIPSGCLVR